MRYSPITCDERAAMLERVGMSSCDELFESVPVEVRLSAPLNLPAGMGELDLSRHMTSLSRASLPATELVCFAGGGCYDRFIPSVVDHVLSRPEFFTAYTPYQPEVSQGTLQAIYEYQTMICELTGMDVSNASMYDGATAFVEGALMASRVTKRSGVVVVGAVNPEWTETLVTYTESGLLDVVTVPHTDGVVDMSALDAAVGQDTAAVLIQNPDYLGNLTDVRVISDIAHAAGALLVLAADPTMLAVLQTPAALGADIYVGEGQTLGNPMSFGGPGLGIFATLSKYIRQMPGRLVGRTVDVDGNQAYVLTLSTREQHIRREKATSNICSNHALNALAAGVYLASMGPEGLRSAATASVSKAHYLREQLLSTSRFTAPWDLPFGMEFALRYDGDPAEFIDSMIDLGFLAGIDLGRDNLVLFAVTEKRTRDEIDLFVTEVEAL